MSGTLRGVFSDAYILAQAEKMEELAFTDPENFEHWQAQANAWRIELPPPELEPGPVFDAEFTEMEPEP
jgi:hypothetical protein